jgi:hypothetical protein
MGGREIVAPRGAGEVGRTLTSPKPAAHPGISLLSAFSVVL